MTEFVFRIRATPELAVQWTMREAMVLFVNDHEKAYVKEALSVVHESFQTIDRVVTTLEQILETTGTSKPRIAETLAMLKEPARRGAHMSQQIHLFLNSAIFGQPDNSGETLQ